MSRIWQVWSSSTPWPLARAVVTLTDHTRDRVSDAPPHTVDVTLLRRHAGPWQVSCPATDDGWPCTRGRHHHGAHQSALMSATKVPFLVARTWAWAVPVPSTRP